MLPSSGRRLRQSMAMPSTVLMSEMASAPPSAAALAMSAMLVTLGVSLARIGSEQALRGRRATSRWHMRRIGAEIDAVGDIGARDVQFDRRDAGLAVELRGHLDELVVRCGRRC